VSGSDHNYIELFGKWHANEPQEQHFSPIFRGRLETSD
jgi:hypothetical protein